MHGIRATFGHQCFSPLDLILKKLTENQVPLICVWKIPILNQLNKVQTSINLSTNSLLISASTYCLLSSYDGEIITVESSVFMLHI
jgi:hypothetical protein